MVARIASARTRCVLSLASQRGKVHMPAELGCLVIIAEHEVDLIAESRIGGRTADLRAMATSDH